MDMKILITEGQLNRIREKLRNEKQFIIEEASNTELGFISILKSTQGKTLNGFNKSMADKFLSSPQNINTLGVILSDKLRLSGLKEKLKELGFDNIDELLKQNSVKIVDKFNEISTSVNANKKLDVNVINLLRDID